MASADETQLAHHLLYGAPRARLQLHGKVGVITRITDDQDCADLIAGHCCGEVQPREALTLDGEVWTESRWQSVGCYLIREVDGQFLAIACVLDFDAGDHKSGDDDTATKAATYARDLCSSGGLPSILVHSPGGRGYHLWLIPKDSQPAGFMRWLVRTIAAATRSQYLTAKIDTFPNQADLAPGMVGDAMPLPGPAKPFHPHGGELLSKVAYIETAALAPYIERWQKSEAIAQLRQQKGRLAAERRARKLREKYGYRSPVEMAARYLNKVPGAVEGQNGDHATFLVCAVLGDFGLDEADAWPLLAAWNARCSPPWRENELRKKLQSSMRSRRNPIGCKVVA